MTNVAEEIVATDVENLILYDGVCGLCNRTVQFLIRRDKNGVLKFTTLQGKYGQEILTRHPGLHATGESVILVRAYDSAAEQAFAKSQAVLMALSEVGGFWRVVSWLRVVPAFVRDFVYDFIARNRYRWFGKYEQCPIPKPAHRDRFLWDE